MQTVHCFTLRKTDRIPDQLQSTVSLYTDSSLDCPSRELPILGTELQDIPDGKEAGEVYHGVNLTISHTFVVLIYREKLTTRRIA